MGRDERFSSPARPSVRHRDSHLRAVRSLTPKPAATSATGRPSSSIRLIISARPSGVVRAFLCGLFILVPCGASCRNDHLQALTGDEQPPQNPQLAGELAPASYCRAAVKIVLWRVTYLKIAPHFLHPAARLTVWRDGGAGARGSRHLMPRFGRARRSRVTKRRAPAQARADTWRTPRDEDVRRICIFVPYRIWLRSIHNPQLHLF